MAFYEETGTLYDLLDTIFVFWYIATSGMGVEDGV
jgi:hypothetical protein